MVNNITTSAGENLTNANVWQLKLQVATVAEEEHRGKHLSLSAAEHILSALIEARTSRIKRLTAWIAGMANSDSYNEARLKECLKDDFVRELNEVESLSFLIDDIATSLAADLREAGNAILLERKKEVSRD
ncbi:hypothetical protein [Spirosoma gilvum]